MAEEQHPHAALAHQFGGPLALVEADIIEDDDIAGLDFGRQLRLDPGLEASALHGGIDDPRRDHAVTAQAGDEGMRLPLAERSLRSSQTATGSKASATTMASASSNGLSIA